MHLFYSDWGYRRDDADVALKLASLWSRHSIALGLFLSPVIAGALYDVWGIVTTTFYPFTINLALVSLSSQILRTQSTNKIFQNLLGQLLFMPLFILWKETVYECSHSKEECLGLKTNKHTL